MRHQWLVSGLCTIFAVSGAAVVSVDAHADATTPDDEVSCTSLEPAEIIDLPDGGKDYQFTIDGELTDVPVPPDGFRPEDADAATLATYAFPPRPTNSEDLAEWTQDMLAYKETPTPKLCLEATASNDAFADGDDVIDPAYPVTIAASTVTNRTSKNWAGWEARPASGNHYVAVSGEYDEITTHADSCTDSQVGTWVGIGGALSRSDGTFGLIQAGTAVGGGNGRYAWYEYLATGALNPPVQVGNLSLSAGDHLHISVFYSSADEKANFIFQNETDGMSQSIVKTVDKKYFQGSSAEFISERPAGPAGYTPLLNFGTTTFTSSKVENNDGDWVHLGDTHEQVRDRMVANGTTYAVPGDITGDTNGKFVNDWRNC